MIVTLAHVRTIPDFGDKPGYCTKQSREWFARHGLDWNAFRHHGIASEVLLASGDALAIALVRHAEDVEARGGE